MLTISSKLRKRIEGLLEPGYYVQLEELGNNIMAYKRPIAEDMLHCPPVAATGEDAARLSLVLYTTGEDPVELANWALDEKMWILGVMTTKTPPVPNKLKSE
jgi:hypothetical protein